jgi:hypothetical protein
MAEVGPSADQILAEWVIDDPAADLARWQEGIRRYEGASSAADGSMSDAAELMCAALTHYVAGESILAGSDDQPPDMMVARTTWNVLLTALQAAHQNELNSATSRRLRLALAAARIGGYQSADLGGGGLMSQLFDPHSQSLMSMALSELLAGADVRPVNLSTWFQDSEPAPGSPAAPSSAGPLASWPSPGRSTWNSMKERARQVHQHANPLALQHGIESVQGALTGANIAKVDKKTGKLKIKKIGVAKAALRPAKTVRQALDGAAVTEHLKAYNESSAARARSQASMSASDTEPSAAVSAAEFASYGLKRDYLRDWARRLVLASGVAPTEQLIVEHAEMAATAISVMVFLRFGARRGISAVDQYFPDGLMPQGTALGTFDAVYAEVADAEGNPRAVDEKIVAFLGSCWEDWTDDIRARHSAENPGAAGGPS